MIHTFSLPEDDLEDRAFHLECMIEELENELEDTRLKITIKEDIAERALINEIPMP